MSLFLPDVVAFGQDMLSQQQKPECTHLIPGPSQSHQVLGLTCLSHRPCCCGACPQGPFLAFAAPWTDNASLILMGFLPWDEVSQTEVQGDTMYNGSQGNTLLPKNDRWFQWGSSNPLLAVTAWALILPPPPTVPCFLVPSWKALTHKPMTVSSATCGTWAKTDILVVSWAQVRS